MSCIFDTNVIIDYIQGNFPDKEANFVESLDIRKNNKIKLPDAVIAATALVYDLELITRNAKDFENIAGLRIKNPWD